GSLRQVRHAPGLAERASQEALEEVDEAGQGALHGSGHGNAGPWLSQDREGQVKNGKTTTKKVKLNKAYPVTGTVTHDGQPVRGMRVAVIWPNTTGCVDWADSDEDTRERGCFDEGSDPVKTD